MTGGKEDDGGQYGGKGADEVGRDVEGEEGEGEEGEEEEGEGEEGEIDAGTVGSDPKDQKHAREAETCCNLDEQSTEWKSSQVQHGGDLDSVCGQSRAYPSKNFVSPLRLKGGASTAAQLQVPTKVDEKGESNTPQEGNEGSAGKKFLNKFASSAFGGGGGGGGFMPARTASYSCLNELVLTKPHKEGEEATLSDEAVKLLEEKLAKDAISAEGEIEVRREEERRNER
eukprot:766968-Hanusia_phi.AAC.1